MSELLIENYSQNLELVESKDAEQLPKGSLGVVKGICADYKDPTRNGRSYSRKLWERVFDDPRIKEGLKTRTLFGELDHPADRLESLTKEAAIVMTDYKFDDANKKVVGEFHILDTPNGRILKSLVDYGSVPGISSRGRGEINEKDNSVVEDSYILGGFDVVTLPSIKSARPDYKLTNESLEVKDFKTSIEKEIEEADLSELVKIESVIEKTELPEETSKLLLESIEQKKSGFSNTVTDDSTTVISNNKLQEDLEKAYKKIGSLEEELKTKKIELKTLSESLEENVKEDEDDLGSFSEEDWTSNAIGNEELYLELLSLKEEFEQAQNKKVNLESLQRLLDENESQLKALKEEKKGLLEKVNYAYERLSSTENELGSLKEQHNILTIEHETIQENLDGFDSQSDMITKLEKDLFETKDSLEEAEKERADLKTALSEAKKDLSKVNKEYLKLQESFDDFVASYVDVRTTQSGLAEKSVMEALPENFSVEDVETVIEGLYEEKARLSNLPFSESLISLKESKPSGKTYDNATKMLNTFKQKPLSKGGKK